MVKKIKAILIFAFWKLVACFCHLCGLYGARGNNILVVDIQAIGDAVMVSPIFKNIKSQLPDGCKLDIVCSSFQKPIYERFQQIDNIYTIQSFEEYYLKHRKLFLGRDFYKVQYSFYVGRYAIHYLANKYSTVIEPRWEEDTVFTSILVMMTGASNRYGYSEKVNKNKARRNFWRDKYFTKCYMHVAACSETKKYLDLIGYIGYKVEHCEIKLKYNCNKDYSNLWGKYVVLALDTTDNRKEWDCDNFVNVAKCIIDKGFSVVLLGVKAQYGSYVSSKVSSNKCVNYVGKTSLSEAIDIIGNSSCYIGCDTGLSHIAGAVDVNGVVIFPSSKLENPESVSSVTRMRPSGKIIVIQPELPLYPCKTDCISKGKAHCINEIKPEEVIMVIEHLLKI